MVGESCKEVIQGKKHRLTNTELKLADYILEHYDEALNYNVTELADSAGVSDASVVRFCKKLGYKGYQDFKVNAAKDVLPRDRHFNPGLEQDDDIETICKKIFLSEVNVLNRTLASLDTNELKVVAEKIEKAEKIVFFGSGGSLIVAKDAAHKFMKIGIRAFVYEDIDLQLMSSSLMNEKEVAIGISHSGSNRNVIDCIKNAKAKLGQKPLQLWDKENTVIKDCGYDIILLVRRDDVRIRISKHKNCAASNYRCNRSNCGIR